MVIESSKFRCYIYQAGTFSSSAFPTASSTFTAGKWYHITITFEQDVNAKIYIDGSLDATSTTNVTGNRETTYGETNLGDGAWGDFNGGIGQYRFYSSTLTADEVMQNYRFTKNDYPNGFNATNNGAVWSSSGHFTFNSTDYFRLPSGAPFNRSDTIQAVSGWFKLASTSDRAFVFNISSTSNTSDYIYFSALGDTSQLSIFTRDGSSSNQSHTVATWTPDTSWHHIVYQIGSTEREIYLDGVKQTVTHTNAGTGSNTSWISYPSYSGTIVGEIGRLRAASPNATHNSDADISEVKLYDKVLTQSEITAEYNKGQYGDN